MGRALLHVFFDRLSTTGGQHTSGLEPKEKKNHSHLFLLKYIPNFRNILSILKLFKSSSTKNAFCTDAIGSETIVSLYA